MEWLILALIFFGISGFLNLIYYAYEGYLRRKDKQSRAPFTQMTEGEILTKSEKQDFLSENKDRRN